MVDRIDDELKFAADKMLGRLVKWLRIIGQDVIHGQHLSGRGLVRAATQERRVMLTRDRRIRRWNPERCIFIRDDHFRRQLKQVVEACGLDPFEGLLTRCVECNEPLRSIARDEVRDAVPPYVFETQEIFSVCPGCRRVFWPATHQRLMVEELKRLGFASPGNGCGPVVGISESFPGSSVGRAGGC